MVKIMVLVSIFFSAIYVSAKTPGLDSLNRVLEKRPVFMELKQRDFDRLKSRLNHADNDEERLSLLNDIYLEYSTFHFDSAMIYLNRMDEVASRGGNREYSDRVRIYKAYLLTTSGLFHEALDCLSQVNRSKLSENLLDEYFLSYEWVYGMLAEYSANSGYASEYYMKEMAYQDSLISTTPQNTSINRYWRAEKAYRTKDYHAARQLYLKALENVPVNERLYAQITFGLALTETALGNQKGRREWLIKAAISDQECPLKENLALQELALDISMEPKADLETANRYLHYSLEDAMFYGNRLRLMEISQKVPSIVSNYEKQLQTANKSRDYIILGFGILALFLIIAICYALREHKKLQRSRKQLEENYNALNHAKEDMEASNKQLSTAVKETRKQKKLAENCISLFMELTAAYINKLNVFQTTVQRKIKAKQVDDLIRYTNPSRMTDAEAREFFINFDQTFLHAFPNFVEKFNALLMPDKQIVLAEGEMMNLDLRIFALIRLGVKDSSKIATLLNYSPQTIYNHRSSVKYRAINRETFESDVELI